VLDDSVPLKPALAAVLQPAAARATPGVPAPASPSSPEFLLQPGALPDLYVRGAPVCGARVAPDH
jgi:hypothetical protein